MPKKINVFQILLITVLGAALAMYILEFSNSIQYKIESSDSIVIKKISTQQETFGNLTFLHDNIAQILRREYNYLSLKIMKGNVGLDENNNIKRDYYFSTTFYLLKNDNPKKLSAENYYWQDPPRNQRQATEPQVEQTVVINKYDAFLEEYQPPFSASQGSPYYNFVRYYITNGFDVYIVEGYRLPETPSSDLTAEDIAAAKEYEKAFDAILQSIEFIDPLKPEPKPELI